MTYTQVYHSPDRKNSWHFQTKLHAICRTNAHLLVNITYEKRITVRIKYRPVISLSCHNQISRTTQIPGLWDFSLTLAKFPDISRNSKKVVTLYTATHEFRKAKFWPAAPKLKNEETPSIGETPPAVLCNYGVLLSTDYVSSRRHQPRNAVTQWPLLVSSFCGRSHRTHCVSVEVRHLESDDRGPATQWPPSVIKDTKGSIQTVDAPCCKIHWLSCV